MSHYSPTRTITDEEFAEWADEDLYNLAARCEEDNPDPNGCDSCGAWYVYTDGTMTDGISDEEMAAAVPLRTLTEEEMDE